MTGSALHLWSDLQHSLFDVDNFLTPTFFFLFFSITEIRKFQILIYCYTVIRPLKPPNILYRKVSKLYIKYFGRDIKMLINSSHLNPYLLWSPQLNFQPIYTNFILDIINRYVNPLIHIKMLFFKNIYREFINSTLIP